VGWERRPLAKYGEPYRYVEVESYEEQSTGGLHGPVHIRPVAGEPYPAGIRVECPREMRGFPVGTRFRIRAKLTDRQGGGEFLYSHHTWHYEVLKA
jgi:hypothetical protein